MGKKFQLYAAFLSRFFIQLLLRLLIAVRSRTDVFDAGTMSQLQFLLVQMAHRSKNVSLNILDSRNYLHVSFQPKVRFSRIVFYLIALKSSYSYIVL